MHHSLIDFFAAIGFALNGKLLYDMGAYVSFGWLILATIGIMWAAKISVAEVDGGALFLKHCLCTLLSAICVFAPKKVDLADYAYTKPGQLQQALGTTMGAAPLPAFATFWLGRSFGKMAKPILATGDTDGVPNVQAAVDIMAQDDAILDDDQLRTNLAIWAEIVAPYLLRSDPNLARELGAAGVMQEFMVPISALSDYTDDYGRKAAKVQEILRRSSATLGNLMCSASPLIDSVASRMGGSSWTPENNTCIAPAIKVTYVADMVSAASNWEFFNDSAAKSWEKGQAFLSQMAAASADVREQGTVTSFDQLYENIGRSVLLVASNRYLGNSDSVMLLGKACDKSGPDPVNCSSLQRGLVPAARGVINSAADARTFRDSTFLGRIGEGFSNVGAWLTSGIARFVMVVLASVVQEIIPVTMGLSIVGGLLISSLAGWLLLIPARFLPSMGWMASIQVWAWLWVILHTIWLNLDPLLMRAIASVGMVFGSDRRMGSNGMSMFISLGYLVMPFFTWNLIYGSSGRALAKTLNASQRMVEAGMVFAAVGTKLGTSLFRWMESPGGGSGGGAAPKGTPSGTGGSGGSPPTNGGIAQGGSAGGARSSAAPPQAAPVSGAPSTNLFGGSVGSGATGTSPPTNPGAPAPGSPATGGSASSGNGPAATSGAGATGGSGQAGASSPRSNAQPAANAPWDPSTTAATTPQPSGGLHRAARPEEGSSQAAQGDSGAVAPPVNAPLRLLE